MKNKIKIPPLALVLLVPILNYLGSFLAGLLGLPLFFDSVGTVLGVVLGGFWIGATGGVIFNLLNALSSGQTDDIIWSLSSVFIALITWLLLKKKSLYMENYPSVFGSAVVLAAFNSIFTTLISHFYFGGQETFPPAVALQNYLAAFLPFNWLGLLVTHLFIELIDKSLVFLAAFGLYYLIKNSEILPVKKLVLPVAVLVVALGFTYWMSSHQQAAYDKEDYDRLVKAQTQQAVSMLHTVYEGYRDGLYPLDQAKKLGADLLRNLRYGDDREGYFWADTSEGTNVVLYGRQDVEGKNRIDSNVGGIYHVREIIANGKKPGGGFTDYYYTKKNGSEVLPKRGYSLYFQPFDWVIGTGYYPGDLQP